MTRSLFFTMSPKRLIKLVVVVVGSGQNKIHLWDFDHWTKVRLRRDNKYFLRDEISSLKDDNGGAPQIPIGFVKDFLLIFFIKSIGFQLEPPLSSGISALRKDVYDFKKENHIYMIQFKRCF